MEQWSWEAMGEGASQEMFTLPGFSGWSLPWGTQIPREGESQLINSPAVI